MHPRSDRCCSRARTPYTRPCSSSVLQTSSLISSIPLEMALMEGDAKPRPPQASAPATSSISAAAPRFLLGQSRPRNACGVKRRRRPGIAGAAGGNSGDIGLYPLCLGPLNCPFSKAFVSGFLIFKSPFSSLELAEIDLFGSLGRRAEARQVLKPAV